MKWLTLSLFYSLSFSFSLSLSRSFTHSFSIYFSLFCHPMGPQRNSEYGGEKKYKHVIQQVLVLTSKKRKVADHIYQKLPSWKGQSHGQALIFILGSIGKKQNKTKSSTTVFWYWIPFCFDFENIRRPRQSVMKNSSKVDIWTSLKHTFGWHWEVILWSVFDSLFEDVKCAIIFFTL